MKLKSNELKKFGIKNRTCYYFDNIIKIKDYDFDILLDENSYENILIYDVSNKTLFGKRLRNMFDEVNGFIKLSGIFQNLIRKRLLRDIETKNNLEFQSATRSNYKHHIFLLCVFSNSTITLP